MNKLTEGIESVLETIVGFFVDDWISTGAVLIVLVAAYLLRPVLSAESDAYLLAGGIGLATLFAVIRRTMNFVRKQRSQVEG